MKDKDLTEALKNIIEKEFNNLSKLIPKDVLENLSNNISPQIEKFLEKSGYVKKSKYQNLEKLINDLEDRIEKLE
tara:strand:+ start:505 stop:729 length:225 start_codon:yes stop_codon:yes gene_type:complete